METGNAAMLELLKGKGYMDGGLNTISAIISKYAPSKENDTAGYIKSVAASTGIDPNAKLNEEQLVKVHDAMAVRESGYRGQEHMKIGANPADPSAAMFDPKYEPDMEFGPISNATSTGMKY